MNFYKFKWENVSLLKIMFITISISDKQKAVKRRSLCPSICVSRLSFFRIYKGEPEKVSHYI